MFRKEIINGKFMSSNKVFSDKETMCQNILGIEDGLNHGA